MKEELQQVTKALEDGGRVFIIRGAAGTGKTTLIRSLVPLLKSRGLDPALMAPTGRAALVLSKRTGMSASTIHSAIYNVKDEPIKDDGGAALKWIFPLKVDKDIENVAFVVDEASMVGLAKHDNDRELFQFGTGSLLGDLVRFSGVTVANTTNVMFFVGDPFQLPPVGEKREVSPALDEEELAKITGCKPVVIELSHVHRQGEGSGVLEEATKIREALSSRDYNVLSLSAHPDVRMEEGATVVNDWLSPSDIDDKIIIAATNVQVREYNGLVRGKFGISDRLPVPGERLLSVRNTRVQLGADNMCNVYNGDLLRVIGISDECMLELDGFYRPKDTNETYSFRYTFKKMSFEWVYEPERGKVEDVWVNVTPILLPEWDDHDNYAAVGLYNGVKQHIEEMLRKKYPDFRKDRAQKRDWDALVQYEMKNSPLLHAPIVKFGYAITGHKSQGGEWDEVWADYSRGGSPHSSFFFRWSYTVTTRAKKNLHVICAPRVDAVSEVFSSVPSVGQKSSLNNANDAASCNSIAELFEVNGLSVDSIVVQNKYKFRMHVTHAVNGEPGWIDVMYRGNGVVSAVDARVGQNAEWSGVLKGMLADDIRKAFTTVAEEGDGVNSGEAEGGSVYRLSSDRKQAVVDRIAGALGMCGFRLVSVEEKTVYQVRLNISATHGFGFVDLYFNAKERLTSRNSTLNSVDIAAIDEALRTVDS